jgi:membrane associated rhomboid family serine protease
VPVRWTLLTSMFMHAGWMHLLGNMLFLWIFGDNIEDDLGHFRFLVFYLLTGVLASLAHVYMNHEGEDARIPSLGASGAISGVLGAYLIRHPQRKVHMLLLFRFIITVPAIVALGVWFAMQMLGGIGSLSGEGDGVAYAAHIGGFVAGGLLIWLFVPSKQRKEMADVHDLREDDLFGGG